MSNIDAKKQQALDAALARINKQLGEGSAYMLNDPKAKSLTIEGESSGSLSLDLAVSGGKGLPYGRITEIYGPEASGKTLIALHTIASAQKSGKVAAFVDVEQAFDPVWARKIGVDVDNLVFSQPETGEDAFETVEQLVLSGVVDVIVLDSVAALVPRKELEGDFGDAQMGSQARLMSQGLRKINGHVKRNNVLLIFINQLREKVGVMFGSPETTTGGRGLKFYASVRLDIRRIDTLKDGTDIIGHVARVKVIKNKVASPHREARFDVISAVPGSEGISQEAEIRDLGVEHGIIKKSGAWFTYNGIQLGQGGEKARLFLSDPENAEIRKEIIDAIMEKVQPKAGETLNNTPAEAIPTVEATPTEVVE